MFNTRLSRLQRLLLFLAAVLVLKVNVAIVLGYRNYLPPDFNSDFLRGRDGYFFGSYQWAFFAHIASGPIALVLGLLLVNETFRLRFPRWHRRLGRVHVVNVLLLVAPSGFWMAFYAAPGPVGGAGFALLSILTAVCVAFGWRRAVERRFAVHRVWMWRSFLLLCSAVVLRIVGGAATVVGVQWPWFDPLASWGSWLVPLVGFEVFRWARRRKTAAGFSGA